MECSKEYALELYRLYSDIAFDCMGGGFIGQHELAKRSAIVCINKMIADMPNIKHHIELIQEVKSELEKL